MTVGIKILTKGNESMAMSLRSALVRICELAAGDLEELPKGVSVGTAIWRLADYALGKVPGDPLSTPEEWADAATETLAQISRSSGIDRDHACRVCFPEGDMLIDGFLCGRHHLGALLALYEAEHDESPRDEVPHDLTGAL